MLPVNKDENNHLDLKKKSRTSVIPTRKNIIVTGYKRRRDILLRDPKNHTCCSDRRTSIKFSGISILIILFCVSLRPSQVGSGSSKGSQEKSFHLKENHFDILN